MAHDRPYAAVLPPFYDDFFLTQRNAQKKHPCKFFVGVYMRPAACYRTPVEIYTNEPMKTPLASSRGAERRAIQSALPKLESA